MKKIYDTENQLRAVADALKEIFEGMGFALIVFDFFKPRISNYISNAERKNMVEALREAADRLKKN